jgi:hypothetical protein
MAKKTDEELQGMIACALDLVEYLESIKGEERATALAAVKMIRVDLAMKDWHPKDRESLNKKAALRHTMGAKGIGALGWLPQTEFNIETITREIYGD